MAGGVRDTDRGWGALREALRDLGGGDVGVLIGVHGDTDSEMVVIAASNEFGTEFDGGHVPERSYLRDTVDRGGGEIADDLQRVVTRSLAGSTQERELGWVGEKWVGRVKQTIRDLDTPPNAPSTIAAKGSDNPLIDQGRLRNSITWSLQRGRVEIVEDV